MLLLCQFCHRIKWHVCIVGGKWRRESIHPRAAEMLPFTHATFFPPAHMLKSSTLLRSVLHKCTTDGKVLENSMAREKKTGNPNAQKRFYRPFLALARIEMGLLTFSLLRNIYYEPAGSVHRYKSMELRVKIDALTLAQLKPIPPLGFIEVNSVQTHQPLN